MQSTATTRVEEKAQELLDRAAYLRKERLSGAVRSVKANRGEPLAENFAPSHKAYERLGFRIIRSK